MRTTISERDNDTTITVTVSIAAINFPLTIQPPPASQTINVARLRAVERRERHRRKAHAAG